MKQLLYIAMLVIILLMGCSSGETTSAAAAKGSGDHVWKAQENAYKKAQAVPPMLEEADRHQRQLMEDQGG